MSLGQHFPPAFRDLLTATGRDFIERAGEDLVRHATLQVLLGHNVRTQTEPLTRQRIAEIGGALLATFYRASQKDPNFYAHLSQLAQTELRSRDLSSRWPAQWTLGLTGKGVQNVLRSERSALSAYLGSFEGALDNAARHLGAELGPLRLKLAVGKAAPDGPALDWDQALRILTVIGCAELAVRGSDKSRYGKLFERLVLGSALTLLGFRLTERDDGGASERVFWLSDSSDERECDATAIVAPGVLARFDIGFIGIGNPEIVRDKLSRFAREVERSGRRSSSTTFVIVDRFPDGRGANTREIAEKSGTALIQMSMSLWPRELAKEMQARLRHSHALCKESDADAEKYIRTRMASVDVMSFLRGASEDDAEEGE